MTRTFESPVPSPPEANHRQPDALDISTPLDRYDSSPVGDLAAETPKVSPQGPRQRRFTFDAGVIRDSVVKKLRDIDRYDLVEGIDGCHREAMFKRCTNCRVVKTFYNRCEHFFCPICAARLARDRREGVELFAQRFHQPKHMILTVKSVATSDNACVRKLKHDYVKLRNQKWAKHGRTEPFACVCPWAKAITFNEFRESIPKRIYISLRDGMIYRRSTKWLGGFWSLDLTWNKPTQKGDYISVNGSTVIAQRDSAGGFHYHLHAAVDSEFIDQEWLEEAWSKIRGQDFSVVKVKPPDTKDYAAEICKYVCDGVSLGNWPAEVLVQFIESLREEKCFGCFGHLYKQRSEWRKDMEAIQADRQLCECGCGQWEIFDENEWEAAHCRGGVSPPTPERKPARIHAELFAPLFGIVK